MIGLLQESDRIVGADLIGVFPGTLDALDVIGAPQLVPVVIQQFLIPPESGQGRARLLVSDI